MEPTTENPRSGAWGNVPDDCHPKVKQLIAYWHSVHTNEGLPAGRHIDPVRCPNLLANIRLIDVVGLPRRFRVRLTGERIREHFGEYHAG
ncbi:MAG: PAS domain-containing protein [Alphaproteobacteria bacterium]|nr:PAS domain-containing protein [Alphaproteobacteria bacterium]